MLKGGIIIELANIENCTGCMLCVAICPNNAIYIERDSVTGFLYPYKDSLRCIKCGVCEKYCPDCAVESKVDTKEQIIYALITMNERIREQCTSGGAFYLFASEMLKSGWAVAGALYDEKCHVYHTLINSEEELSPLLRSKYVQSDMRKVYPLIEDALNANKKVLFCGTPCQVAAVKKFGEINNKSDNLLLIDLICRGVPSDKIQDLYLEQLCKEKGSRVVKIEYKDKTLGWHKLGTKYTLENGETFVESVDESSLLTCFPGLDLSTRESCFHCQYKTQERVSDITIGDFWGLNDPEWDDDRGTSLVFINTRKGRELFEKIKSKIRYKEFSFSDVINHGNIMAFSELPENSWMRERFWQQIGKGDFRKTVNSIVDDYRELDGNRNRADRAERKYKILLRWMELKNRGIELKEYFEDNGINSAAVYGAGEIGILFGETLCGQMDIIKYYLDQNPRDAASAEIPLKVFSLNSPEIFPVDVIITTPVLITDEIENAIWNRFPGQKVCEVEEILYYLSRKHGLDLSLWGLT